MKLKQNRNTPRRPRVVATVHSLRGLREAGQLRRGEVDFLEVRLDLLAGAVTALRTALPTWRVPVLLTARHPAEGGAKKITASRRRDLLLEFLPQAAAVDIELRSVGTLAPVLRQAQTLGLQRLVSFHDFGGTPSLARLRKVAAAARRAGADLVKIATQLRNPHDLAVLLELQASLPDVALATMGMGPLGRVSRLALAAAGSQLNYGYLDRPQVPGQWPALELKRRIAEVLP
ncbi:MAG: type I 3-dehydroquinate dehydratase [Chthoniobacterales bacterium]